MRGKNENVVNSFRSREIKCLNRHIFILRELFPLSMPFLNIYARVVLRKRAPKCDIELFALDLLVLVANRLVQCATYTV